MHQYGTHGGAGSAGVHIVGTGDNLWTIAERYKLSLQDIVHMNRLAPPYHLQPGQRLRLPPPQSYKVRAGDTLYHISRTFNVSMTELARLNNLSAPYSVAQGRVLRLPSVRGGDKAGVATQKAAQQAPTMPARAAPKVEAEKLPEVKGAASPKAFPAPTVPTDIATAPPPRPVKIPDTTPPRAGDKFAWPVSGKIISTYGPKKDGLHNDGINIAAARGAPVRAAENGVIVYAGSELKGFGNLILIRHADRWMSAYAHMDHLRVARGQTVKQGDVIGVVGTSGTVTTPQLHFEIRRGTQALNPVIWLTK